LESGGIGKIQGWIDGGSWSCRVRDGSRRGLIKAGGGIVEESSCGVDEAGDGLLGGETLLPLDVLAH
jgi:hypothetical protein